MTFSSIFAPSQNSSIWDENILDSENKWYRDGGVKTPGNKLQFEPFFYVMLLS